MPRPRSIAVPLLALLAACASSKEERAGGGPEEYVPITSQEPAPIGKFLTDLDARIRAWTNLTMTARSDEERVQARELGAVIRRDTRQRLDELTAELESGPPRNRQRAAAALGFSDDPAALSPLLAALEDSDSDVVHNALLGLALLGLPETPTDRIVALLGEHSDPQTRSNAAYALRSIAEAGADTAQLVGPARMALIDPAPGVRVQACLLVGLAGDGESVQRLADLLHDDEPLVQMAATEGLVLVGKRSGPDKGAAARALVAAWSKATGAEQDRLRRALAMLAGEDKGGDEEPWLEWSHNLP